MARDVGRWKPAGKPGCGSGCSPGRGGGMKGARASSISAVKLRGAKAEWRPGYGDGVRGVKADLMFPGPPGVLSSGVAVTGGLKGLNAAAR